MGLRIEDGRGSGVDAHVSEAGYLSTSAVVRDVTAYGSENGDTFQFNGSYTVTGSGTFTLLHIRNTSTSKLGMLTRIVGQPVGLAGGNFGTATYFTLGSGQTYDTGGTAVTATNLNLGSGKAPPATAYTNNPTLAGTLKTISNWYPDGNQDFFNVEFDGSIILEQGTSLIIKGTTDHTSGLLIAGVSMAFIELEEIH